MRSSLLIMLLAAVSQINAAATPYSASKCTLTSSKGAGQGDGYKGDCCVDQSDCIDDCVMGACIGPVNTKTVTGTKTSTTAATPTVVPGKCTPGSFGLGKGDGFKGDCCNDQSDCQDDCVNGSCNGPVNTKTTIVSPTTTASPTATVGPATCTPGSSGLGKGDGYKGACCKNEADCQDDCVKGVCNGPINTKTTTVATTTTATATPTVAPGTCTPGSSGLGKGDGYKGACCKNEADCQDDCVKGVCNGPVNTKTTAAPTATTTASACKSGFFGKNNGGGGDNACCKTSNDCQESCLEGRCGLA